jgi:hypothetical protein
MSEICGVGTKQHAEVVLGNLEAKHPLPVDLEHGNLDPVRALERVDAGDVDDLECDTERSVSGNGGGGSERVPAEVAPLGHIEREAVTAQG